MEQSERDNAKLTPRHVPLLEQEIPAVLAFIAYLEDFQDTMEYVKEQSKKNLYGSATVSRQYDEGIYGIDDWYFFMGMDYLMKLLYEAVRGSRGARQGRMLLTENDVQGLFSNVAHYLGCANLLHLGFWAADGLYLIDFRTPLDWVAARARATEDMQRLKQYREFGSYLPFIKFSSDRSYRYGKPVSQIDADTVANSILDGEEQRLRAFLTALHSTLRLLATIGEKLTVQVKVPPINNLREWEQTIQVFSDTIQLLRAVVNAFSLSSPGGVIEPDVYQQLFLNQLEQTKNQETELLQLEVAGSVLMVSSREAALVVYADCQYQGVQVNVATAYGQKVSAYVIERNVGKNTSCAAIFPRLSLYGATSIQVVVICNTLKLSGSGNELNVTVFAGNVTEAYLQR